MKPQMIRLPHRAPRPPYRPTPGEVGMLAVLVVAHLAVLTAGVLLFPL